jgi:flavin-dependent dehydrogenase
VDRVDVAIVGGGPAGAAVATLLARAGHQVMIIERAPGWRWRAGGVFCSPAAVAAARRIGLDAATVSRVARRIPAMRVECPDGVAFSLTYGAGSGGPSAVGFDRAGLDTALLHLATSGPTGAVLRPGTTVRGIAWPSRAGEDATIDVVGPAGPASLTATVVVGADGIRSTVARSVGVVRRARLGPRVGLTYHVVDPRPDDVIDARLRIIDDGYVGVAPVAGGRINLGVVLGPSWRPALARDGAAAVADRIVAGIPPTEDDPADWRRSARTDAIAGAAPIAHRVARRAGPGWLLVGDAAGFLDPFTGEGLHRALVSAELAATAIDAHLRGRRDALAGYDRAMHRRFVAKDAVSWLVQGFLAQPALFGYAARRLSSRPGVRATMGLVMGDLVPATRGLDPRYLAALLAP